MKKDTDPMHLLTGYMVSDPVRIPITGMKSKVLAAHRAGIKRIILPQRNEPDLTDVPSEVQERFEFVMVQSMADALEVALETAVLESVERREAPVSRSAYSRQTTG